MDFVVHLHLLSDLAHWDLIPKLELLYLLRRVHILLGLPSGVFVAEVFPFHQVQLVDLHIQV